jgi:hypothetical protein
MKQFTRNAVQVLSVLGLLSVILSVFLKKSRLTNNPYPVLDTIIEVTLLIGIIFFIIAFALRFFVRD